MAQLINNICPSLHLIPQNSTLRSFLFWEQYDRIRTNWRNSKRESTSHQIISVLSSLKREFSIGRASYRDRITQHAFNSLESRTHKCVQMVDSLKNQARTESVATNASLRVCAIPSRAECAHSVYYPSGKNQRTELLTISFIQSCECIKKEHIQLHCQLNALHPAFSLRNAHNECI